MSVEKLSKLLDACPVLFHFGNARSIRAGEQRRLNLDIKQVNSAGIFDQQLDSRWKGVCCEKYNVVGWTEKRDKKKLVDKDGALLFCKVLFDKENSIECFDTDENGVFRVASVYSEFRRFIEPCVNMTFELYYRTENKIYAILEENCIIKIDCGTYFKVQTNVRISTVDKTRKKLRDIGATNIELDPPTLFAKQTRGTMHKLVDEVIALESTGLPAYVLLWTLNWLPEYSDLFFTEAKKINLIENTINSIRRVRQSRTNSK